MSSDFWRFWTGQTISRLGGSFTAFATPLLIFKLTHSGVDLGISTATSYGPWLLFGLLFGAFVDRKDRKRLMIGTDVARAAVIALIPLLGALHVLEVWQIYVIGFASATLGILFTSAEFAAIPSLVSHADLVTANGRIQASYATATVAGPLLAGVMVTTVPLTVVFSVDAASFVVSATSLGLVRAGFNQGQRPARRPTLRVDIAEGLRYVLAHPVLRNLSAMMALINFLTASVATQLVLFAKVRLQASDLRVGLLFSAGAIGAALLGLVAGRLRQYVAFGPAILGSISVQGLLVIGLALSQIYWLALVLWGTYLGLSVFFNVNTGTLRQVIVPNQLLGRVRSIASVLAWSAIPLGSLVGGYAVGWSGNVAYVYAAIGVLVVVTAGLFSVLSPLGRADRFLPGGDLEVSLQSEATLSKAVG